MKGVRIDQRVLHVKGNEVSTREKKMGGVYFLPWDIGLELQGKPVCETSFGGGGKEPWFACIAL